MTTTATAPTGSAPTANTTAGPTATGTGLPSRPNRYVSTSLVKGVAVAVQIAVRTGGCCLIDGPVGVGKTTAVVEAARALDCDAVYVNMFGTSTPRDQMDAIWTAITGTRGVGTAAQIRDDILDTLGRRRMVLIIDDAHHVGLKGLAPILAIWNRLHTSRGTGTPIVLCGNSLERHLKQTLPELLSRSSTRFVANPLTAKHIVDAVLAMEPTIAGTPAETIRNINARHFRGEIRRWGQFFDILALFRGGVTEPQPLTDDEVKQILSMMPGGNQ